jgi:hypothetical protein
MARNRWNHRVEFAIKFFASKQAFLAESALYSDRASPWLQFCLRCAAVGQKLQTFLPSFLGCKIALYMIGQLWLLVLR